MGTLSKALVAVGCIMLVSVTTYAAPPDWNKGSMDKRVRTLSDLQPGTGTVMIEYGRRMAATYYAAMGGNWGMAGYQAKEMTEIQEVGEATRPKRAKPLKKFEKDYLVNLSKAIESKNTAQFRTAFFNAVGACNACHDDQGFSFIKFELPDASPSPTSNNPQPKKVGPKGFDVGS